MGYLNTENYIDKEWQIWKHLVTVYAERYQITFSRENTIHNTFSITYFVFECLLQYIQFLPFNNENILYLRAKANKKHWPTDKD